jgi:hypothetical protein
MDIKFDLNDIILKPELTSDIESRKQCEISYLPLFNAPMDSVITDDNYKKFLYKLNVIIPRKKSKDIKHYYQYNDHLFVSYSLQQFYDMFIKNDLVINNQLQYKKNYVLIDIANGHMKELYNIIKKAKQIYGNKLIIIAGNVGTPQAYKKLSDAGADYVRIGIGSGNACLTTENTAIGTAIGSLIYETYQIKKQIENPAYIIADGGMKKYSDIIKSLALGADFVMIGSLINKSFESSGGFCYKGIKITEKLAKILFKSGFNVKKKFRGMSTKEVQKLLGKERLVSSEGIVSLNKIDYFFDDWLENFNDYLRSAMSYTNSKTLYDFVGNVDFDLITYNALKRYTK